ncbi:hypothetical protein AAFF_G00053920 [Aldrovandia affinis]|uniref:RRM domain-containing protein n=1 Tax=Aldrovandia affinis TaxID=143900 RepID=A0AAD7WEP5_9TELE|nr:hypothetical protein AAFF_G00053920 [Aldrovandia affinis]
MSHNYPYGRSPEDFVSRQGAFATSDNLRREERDVCRTSLLPSSRSAPTYTTSNSALESYSPQSSTTAENALGLLSSCGLEPEDISVLAGMPESLITEETLPRLLMELRQKKALRDRTTCYPPFRPSSDTWEGLSHTSSAEYQGNPPQRSSYPPNPPQHSSYPLPREEAESWQDRWGNPRQSATGRPKRTESNYVVDYNYGQTQEDDSRSNERPAYSTRAGGIAEPRYSQSSSDYRQVNPAKGPAVPRQRKQILPSAARTPLNPTAREADDFHGATPQTFPYACSLCDIAVLSQKDWTLHINGAQHADSQLAVLQMYPDWDCRNGSVRQSGYHSEKGREEEKPRATRHRAPQHQVATSGLSGMCRPAIQKRDGRVICAKYAANSVDEDCVRRLVRPFGSAVNVMMFPVQAFIEMSAPNEADDIVKYYSRNPAVVEGSQVQFSLSAMYNFLQNSPVVVFSLLPPGNEKYPELVAIAKRFGSVKHSLFLPNRVLLEMGSRPDAEKLVQYYASHPLKMKGKNIQVSHSTKHSTLKVVIPDMDSGDGAEASRSSGQSYRSQKRRSPSPRRRSPSHRRRYSSPKRKSPSPRRGSREKRDVTLRAKDKTSEERTRSSSRHRSQSSRSSTSLTREGKSTSRGHSVEKVADTQKRAVKGDKASEEAPNLGSNQQSSCTRAQTKESMPSPREEPKEDDIDQDTQDQAGFEGGEDSDIEGMQVIGEDEEMRSEEGSMEFLEELEEGAQTDVAGPEKTSEDVSVARSSEVPDVSEEEKCGETEEASTEEPAGQPDQEPVSQTPTMDDTTSEPPAVKAMEEEKWQESEERVEGPEAYEEEEPDFPESLEHCITLDELEDEEDEDQTVSEGHSDQRSREENQDNYSGKVVYIENLPNGYYTDAQFVKIAREYGKVKRYFLLRRRQEGFIEMERAEDAQRAVRELSKKRVEMDDHNLTFHLSRKYKRLTCGWSPEPDSDNESRRRKCRREKSRRGQRDNSSSRNQSRDEEEPAAKKACIREKNTTPEEPSSSIKEEEKPATEEPSSSIKEEEKPATEEPSSSREQEKQQEEEEEEKGTSETPCEQKESETENKDGQISQACDSMGAQRKDTEGETNSEKPDGRIEQVCVKEEKVETMSDHTHGPLGPYLPNNPMGMEFVSSKVGYFCSLCNAIYVSEDEAREEHCSSLSHFQKLKAYFERNSDPERVM